MQIFHEGDSYFNSMIADIKSSKESICIEFYIFKTDFLGKKILAELVEASHRGVKIQMIIDGIGSFWWINGIKDTLKDTSVQIRVFRGIPLYKLNVYKIFNFSYLKSILLFLKVINKRNHRKVVVIDDQVGYLGGLNVSSEHCAEFVGPMAWRDSGIRVEGPPVADLKKSFIKLWSKKRFMKIRSAWLIFNFTLRDRFFSHRDLIKKINTAEKIQIVNAYFVPVRSIIRALRKAAQRGAQVQIVLPYESDIVFLKWASKTFYHKLIKSGVEIYEYKGSILHAKYMIIDNWARIGSNNLNHRSLLHDLEADTVLVDLPSLINLRNQFAIDVQKSERITLEGSKMFFLSKIKSYLVLYFRYWL